MNIDRRTILTLAAGAPLTFTLNAAAQTTTKLPRVAYVWLANEGPSGPRADQFRKRMGEIGWIDKRNIALDYRDAHGNPAELDAIMQELVQSKVDVIVAMCTPEALSAMKFTTTIPIVVAASGDAVAAGLTKSLARPSGNLTGINGMLLEMSAKRVSLMKEVFPRLSQSSMLWNPGRPDNRAEMKVVQESGLRAGVKVESREVRSREELVTQLDALGWDGTQSIITSGDTLVGTERRSIVDRALKLRLPTMFDERGYVEAGGLMSYGPNVDEFHRRAADYVDKILKGAKPADLPFEQPTKFEFLINKKTAKALGVTIPRSVLLQADEVIE